MKLIRKLIRFIDWGIDELLWFCLKPIIKLVNQRFPCLTFSIGISTFMDRFDNCFRPLLKKISLLFPRCQIIVIANGHVKYKEQTNYLIKIADFCKLFSNVELISYSEPKGLSYLWNKIIHASKHNKILIMNDDIKIKNNFPYFINKTGLIKEDIATINLSWSHFLISKEIIKKVGLFDEGFQELGGEDDDYAARLAMAEIPVRNFTTNTIASKLRRKRKLTKINSYGKDMNYEKNGYSNINSEYLKAKWEMSMEPFEGAIKVPDRSMKYWRLKSNYKNVITNTNNDTK